MSKLRKALQFNPPTLDWVCRKVPDDLIIVCDTNEYIDDHCGLFNPPPDMGIEFIRRHHTSGDYTINGYEDKFAVERKRFSDLW